MNLADCIPKDKFDTSAVVRAAEIGFPELNQVLPELLEWVQDANWPVAEDLYDVLAGAGPEIAPHIIAVFAGDDECWKYFILCFLVGKLKPEVAALLRPAIERLAQHANEREVHGDVDEAAREVLANWSGMAQ